jgi:hypothetical protein
MQGIGQNRNSGFADRRGSPVLGGMIKRDAGNRLAPTPQGRSAPDALLGKDWRAPVRHHRCRRRPNCREPGLGRHHGSDSLAARFSRPAYVAHPRQPDGMDCWRSQRSDSDRRRLFAPAAGSDFATNYTSDPNVPYGVFKTSLQCRQAYMSDYACVTSAEARRIACENAAFAGRTNSCPPPPKCTGSKCF